MSEGNGKIKTMNRNNEARRKAESKELFRLMLKAPHLVELPKKYKGSRQSNKAKAIKESE
jgi:hypothetical protein